MPKKCCLNISALSNPNSFHLPIYPSPYPVSNPDSDPNSMFPPMTTLVNSGSSHCFIDPAYIALHKIPTVPIPHPIPLCLFDGLLGQTITQVVTEFSVRFPSRDILPLTFYVTSLDSSYSVVLGYSWLIHYNPGLD